MKVLISGFEPFNNSGKNPSEEIVKGLPNEIAGAEIIKAFLPVSYKMSFLTLKEFIDEHEPDVILCLGLANGRTAITIERVAINMNSASISDNDGYTYIDSPIRKDGKCAHFSSLPIRKMMVAMNDIAPTQISNTAGTYVCNNIMFKVLEYVKDPVLAGFIHVPMMVGMDNPKGFYEMDLNDMIQAITKGIEVICG